jgi:D-alanyl-D-alanine carboxypeptidase
MNEKARELGMDSTHFTNATGRHEPEQYTTARDMAVLLDYALNNKAFYKIFTSQSHAVSGVDGYMADGASERTGGQAPGAPPLGGTDMQYGGTDRQSGNSDRQADNSGRQTDSSDRQTGGSGRQIGDIIFHSSILSKTSGDYDGFNLLGGKTGYTYEAGQCLASLWEKDGDRYIVVTAGARVESNQYETKHLEDATTLISIL